MVECLHGTGVSPCRVPERADMNEEVRRSRRREKFAKSWQTRDTAASFGGGRVVRLRRESTVRAAYSYAV